MMINIKTKSIRQILIYVYLIAVMLLALIAAVISGRQVSQHVKHETIDIIKRSAERLASDSRLGIIQASPENVIKPLQEARKTRNIDAITILKKNGGILAGNKDLSIDIDLVLRSKYTDNLASIVKETERYVYIVAPVTIKQEFDVDFEINLLTHGTDETETSTIGYVLYIFNKQELIQVRDRVRLETLLYILTVSCVLLAILMIILGVIIKPLKKLTNLMNDPVTAEEYKHAKVTGSSEVMEISIAFNNLMMDLERASKNMENTVSERTKELRIARDQADKLNSENRALIRGMNSTLEDERKYIARELHDHLSPDLIFVKLKIGKLRALLREAEKENAGTAIAEESALNKVNLIVEETLTKIGDVYESSRNIVRMLRPEVIDSLGLMGAIDDRIDMFSNAQPDCRFVFNHEGDYGDIDYNLSMVLFRIIQESLTNASKYAEATEVTINLKRVTSPSGENVILTIHDNGKGFDIGDNINKGIGLISMRERAFSVDGIFNVHSGPGLGTTITVTIPVPNI